MSIPIHRFAIMVLSCLWVIIVMAFFYVLRGHGDASGWPANAVHNWNQYGFGALHGKLVTNPGGFAVLTNPEIYSGHSAVSYYPVFATGLVLGWLGDGILIYHLIFSLALFLSVWFLLGRGQLAWICAFAALLCPGYSIYPTVVDPNAVALYMTLPFAAVVVFILTGHCISPLRLTFLAVVVFAYTSLNWSTLLGHGILFCALLVMPAVSWRRLGIYIALASLSGGVVGSLAVIEKMGLSAGHAGAGHFLDFLAGYTWGQTGYGVDLTTNKAILRLSVVNCIGLFPLLGFIAWFLVKFRYADPRKDMLAFLPLLGSISGIMTMRNYFGHHPWMATPMLLPGLVLSLVLLLRPRVNESDGSKHSFVGWKYIVCCFFYALMVLAAFRLYQADSLEVASFVCQHTDRSDIIAVAKNLDPEMSRQADYLSEKCDRHLVVLDDLKNPPIDGGNVFLLSAARLPSQYLMIAQSKKPSLLSMPLVRDLSAFYAQKIARRNAEDRHFDYTANATFCLYRLPSRVH